MIRRPPRSTLFPHDALPISYQALKVLDVDSNSSQEEIKAAFRKKALEHHPDKNKNKNEDLEFKRITETDRRAHV